MPGKSDLIREVLSVMPDASAPEIASEVFSRYGVTVAVGSVRAVKSRDNARGAPPGPVRVIPYRHRARKPVVPVIADEYDDNCDDRPDAEQEIAREYPRTPRARSMPRVRNPVRVPVTVDDGFSDDRADDELYALIESVETAVRNSISGRPQAITGSPELIRTITEICDDPEVRAANQPFRYEVLTAVDGTQTLRLYADMPVPHKPVRESRRGKAAGRESGCEWCAGRQPVPGISLYLVHGGALGNRQRILCHMHAAPEAAAGATVVPYRVYPELYSGAAVIMPAKTPMQELRERVIRSAGYALGYGLAPDYGDVPGSAASLPGLTGFHSNTESLRTQVYMRPTTGHVNTVATERLAYSRSIFTRCSDPHVARGSEASRCSTCCRASC